MGNQAGGGNLFGASRLKGVVPPSLPPPSPSLPPSYLPHTEEMGGITTGNVTPGGPTGGFIPSILGTAPSLGTLPPVQTPPISTYPGSPGISSAPMGRPTYPGTEARPQSKPRPPRGTTGPRPLGMF